MKKFFLLCYFGLALAILASADVASYLERNPFPGAVLVQRDSTTMYTRGDSRLASQIGSITKVFTAVCIMRLEERGLLSLHDTVSSYLDFPNGSEITIEQLLDHTSGIPDYFNEPVDVEHMVEVALSYHPVGGLLTLFANRPLNFQPGSEYRYSNSGFVVLGAIIEKVSGKSYAAYVQDEILTPLGMSETGVLRNPPNVEVATGATAFDRLPDGKSVDPSFYSSAGGIVSTARDLALFGRALLDNSLLTEASFRTMTTPRMGNYGLGWAADSRRQPFSGGHNGRTIGFSASFSVDKKTGTVVVLLVHSDLLPTDQVGENVALIARRVTKG